MDRLLSEDSNNEDASAASNSSDSDSSNPGNQYDADYHTKAVSTPYSSYSPVFFANSRAGVQDCQHGHFADQNPWTRKRSELWNEDFACLDVNDTSAGRDLSDGVIDTVINLKTEPSCSLWIYNADVINISLSAGNIVTDVNLDMLRLGEMIKRRFVLMPVFAKKH